MKLGRTFPRGFSQETDFAWPLTRAGELVDLNYGKALVEKNRRPGDVPVYGTNGQCGWHDEPLAAGPTVILGRKGMGNLGVEWCDRDFWVIDTAYYVTPKTGELDLKFFYYLIDYIGLNHLKDGTSNPSLSRDTFAVQLLPCPPLVEQKAIVEILGSLDDKIELNRQTNETLEGMARAIFKSWFVDFDPVRAKAAGRKPAGMDADTAALFPDRFEDSPLGKIPKGWKAGSLLDHACLLSGGTPKTDEPDYWGGAVPWASAKDVSQCGETFLISTERTITERGLENSSTRIIDANSTVIVARGATTGRMAMFGMPIAMNQTCYALRSKEGSHFFLYCQARHVIGDLVHSAHGSVFDTITTRTFETTPVLVPDPAVTAAFDRAVHPLFLQIVARQKEAAALVAARDALLPKLLSGELRLPDWEIEND